MAIIHHQFESIHPFHDGNGRMGRILNILYLTQQGLLTLPVLYLSRYIIEHKDDYYRLLQEVHEKENWDGWCHWLLVGVERTARDSIGKINAIKSLMQRYKSGIREKCNFYSQDLINALFRFPYTKIEFIEKELDIHRHTARKYLVALAENGYMSKIRLGKSHYYFNLPLYDILKGSE